MACTLMTGPRRDRALARMALRCTTSPAAVPTQAARSRPRVGWQRVIETVRVTPGDLQCRDCT